MIASFPALRFLNSFLVFAHHENTINNPFLVALGPCAVSFFFILSGFGISLGYYQKALLSGFSWKDFVVKRIIRIYPLHLLGLAFWYFLNYKTIQMTGGGAGAQVDWQRAVASKLDSQNEFLLLWKRCQLVFV